MVVGRQPHGGQNEPEIKKLNKNFLKSNGLPSQIILAPSQINAFNGLFGVSGKLIFASTYSGN